MYAIRSYYVTPELNARVSEADEYVKTALVNAILGKPEGEPTIGDYVAAVAAAMEAAKVKARRA